MKNYKVKRAISYFVDLIIISIIISLLSNIKAINPKYEEYREAYSKYTEKINGAVQNDNTTYIMDKEMEHIMYEISYYSISYTIIECAVIILYFTLFPALFDGQTIGKKLLKLKIVDEESEQKTSLFKYFIRSLLQPMFSTGLFYCSLTLIGNLLFLVIFKENHFVTINKVFMMTGIIWGYVDTIYCLSRDDHKSIHDTITKTRVIDVTNK